MEAGTGATLFLGLQALGNWYLVDLLLNPVLLESSALMVHIDPSVIIKTEFPLHRLSVFVLGSLVWNFAVHCLSRSRFVALAESAPRHRLDYEAMLSAGLLITIFSHLTILLCGIHPTMCPMHTLLSAFYVAFNMLLPATQSSFARESQPNPITEALASRTFSRLQGVSSYLLGPTDRKFERGDLSAQIMNQFATQCSIIGIVASSILRVLDHGLQCQRYPIPIVYGFIYGRLAGVTLGFIWISACSNDRKPR